MPFFRDEIEYLKDNPHGYWFKRKLYGWGWTPATWQGWTIIGSFIAFIIWDLRRISFMYPTGDTSAYVSVLHVFLATAILIAICYYSGEQPRWQWGKKKE